MKPHFLLELNYIDLKVSIEAKTGVATVSSLMLASALMSEAKKEGYPKPKVKMRLKSEGKDS